MPPWLVLVAAVAAISFAGPLTRLSSAQPLAVAVWRLGLSVLIVSLFLARGRGWRQWQLLTRREVAAGLGVRQPRERPTEGDRSHGCDEHDPRGHGAGV